MASAWAEPLVIESWRAEDQVIWDEYLLPAFHARHPGIRVVFRPEPALEYDTRLNGRLSNRMAGDLIFCRAFDESNKIYQRGYFEPLPKDLLAIFDSEARLPWTSDDGSDTYCLPVASVTHGYLYNKAVFRELGLQVPRTHAELMALLEAVRRDGRYMPLAFGTADRWETTQVLFTGMGPNYWGGEKGRQALLRGDLSFRTEGFMQPWRWLSTLAPYLPKDYRSLSNADARLLFATGNAAVYPTGSWDLPFLRETHFPSRHRVEVGVFPPTTERPDSECHVSAPPDFAIGVNRHSTHKAEALLFLRWLASPEFSRLLGSVVGGFYALSPHPAVIQDPVAQEMFDWRHRCQPTIRLNAYLMNRYYPPLEEELWNVNVNVVNRTMTPEEAAERLQGVHDLNRQRVLLMR